MTREEQIEQESYRWFLKDFYETNGGENPDQEDVENAFQRGAEWADQHPQWIPVEEMLPKADGRYIIADKYGGIEQMNFDAESKYWWLRGTGKMSDFVTHWMPLPQPPRKEE